MGALASRKAIAAIISWCERPDWRERWNSVTDAHLAPVLEDYNLTPEELAELLGPSAYSQFLGCIFEDFLTCSFEPDGVNAVDDYLHRRGWKEPAPVKRYLEALRDSVMSVWEVVETVPGSHFLARDLIRGGAPVRVEDKLGSADLQRWDRIGARMLPIGSKTYMAGGALRLTFEDAAEIIEDIADAAKKFNKHLKRDVVRRGLAPDQIAEFPADELALREAPPVFTDVWLTTQLDQALGRTVPKLMNSDGEDLVFCETRFPIADPQATAGVVERLDRLAACERNAPDEASWSWVAGDGSRPPPQRPDVPRGLFVGTEDEAGSAVLGSIRLDGETVVLETNSVERADRGRALLTDTLDGLVGEPTTTMQDAGDALAEGAEAGPATAAPQSPLPPEETAALLGEALDRHYHAVLAQPIPMLGGRSPKAAARTETGRRKVAEWLKQLENTAAHQAAAGQIPPYDFSWMWRELKLTDLRE